MAQTSLSCKQGNIFYSPRTEPKLDHPVSISLLLPLRNDNLNISSNLITYLPILFPATRQSRYHGSNFFFLFILCSASHLLRVSFAPLHFLDTPFVISVLFSTLFLFSSLFLSPFLLPLSLFLVFLYFRFVRFFSSLHEYVYISN